MTVLKMCCLHKLSPLDWHQMLHVNYRDNYHNHDNFACNNRNMQNCHCHFSICDQVSQSVQYSMHSVIIYHVAFVVCCVTSLLSTGTVVTTSSPIESDSNYQAIRIRTLQKKQVIKNKASTCLAHFSQSFAVANGSTGLGSICVCISQLFVCVLACILLYYM